ncbi:acyl-CoA dehydrogenase family protein [Nocardia vinacea]|uniref:Acyl-CoA dehydrogenase family protein n=1 Tax=Nocardia vinacea TaxID=96468 RepID=A0ABZ1YTJ8_9NOCA|nr:acyl-CoA dehydrogenase family protein [Nocardia vinacea]
MDFLETPEQQKLRFELRQYLDEMVTPEVRAQLLREGESSTLFLELVKKMGHDGWLGIGWPTEYGGRGLGPMEEYIFFDEVKRAWAPVNFVTVSTVGPTLIAYGTEEQKKRFLPPILRGELQVSIGYSEPEAGTDLASLRTKGVRDGDHYVVNGTKVFTTRAQVADYIWLACRTDPDAPKHKGISIMLVPTDQPGFSWSPIPTVGGTTTTATYYQNVRVPVENLVGQENEGWRLVTSQLNRERVGQAAFVGLAERLYEDLLGWCRSAGSDGSRMIDSPWVRNDLARVAATLRAVRLVNLDMATSMTRGVVSPAEASAAKVFGTEATVDAYRTMLGVLGAASYLPAGSVGALLNGELEHAARESQINTFGGGTNDMQREIIAWTGIGMKRDTGGVR